MKKKVLSDHKRVGKTFIPPAQHLIGFTEVPFVERLLPEVAWVGFFLRVLGNRLGISTVLEFGKACWDQKSRGEFRGFPLASSFKCLSPADWQHVKDTLAAKDIYGHCCKALLPFVHCYPKSNPFIGLAAAPNQSPTPAEID